MKDEKQYKYYRNIEELKEWSSNPRDVKDVDFKRLKRQIQDLGEYKPLLITEDGTVIGGNMRLKAYKELGYNKIWVSVIDAKTDDEKLKYALSDNDNVGYYLEEELKELLTNAGPDFDLDEFKVDLTEPKQLRKMVEDIEKKERELTYQSEYQVVVMCKDEKEQEEVYEKLKKDGMTCKILTL